MSNMSYCRFHNTLLDLRDCASALEDMDQEEQHPRDELSEEEYRAFKNLVEVCAALADRWAE